MIQIGSVIKVADNTGGKTAKIIGIPGGTKNRYATIGSVVNISIKKALPHGMVEEHGKYKAVIVRTHKEFRRKDGSYIRFDDNACVILEIDKISKTKPKGARVFGPIARELKDLKYDKIISLAPEVL